MAALSASCFSGFETARRTRAFVLSSSTSLADDGLDSRVSQARSISSSIVFIASFLFVSKSSSSCWPFIRQLSRHHEHENSREQGLTTTTDRDDRRDDQALLFVVRTVRRFVTVLLERPRCRFLGRIIARFLTGRRRFRGRILHHRYRRKRRRPRRDVRHVRRRELIRHHATHARRGSVIVRGLRRDLSTQRVLPPTRLLGRFEVKPEER